MPASSSMQGREFDVAAIRGDFPILDQPGSGPQLAYLDSAATSLKPRAVADAIADVYLRCTANVGRGIHRLSNEATERFEAGREVIAGFINAEPNEVAFVRNATEAVNLVSRSFGKDAAVVTTHAEHHSNLLPWQLHHPVTCCGLLEDGRVDLAELEHIVAAERPEIIAVSHVSNVLGSVNPLEEIIALARRSGCKVFVDASQSVPHRPFDVSRLGCDYACFSGHKMLGPSGIGVLYANSDLMQELDPLNIGGGTVEHVSHDEFTWRRAPWRLEAGTPPIEGVIGLAAACDYLEDVGRDRIDGYVRKLVDYALTRLAEVPDVRIRGPLDAAHRGPTVSWTMERLDVHTVARILSDRHNICVRSGYHCAEPVHRYFEMTPTLRASFYLYNTADEVDRLRQALTSLEQYRND